MASVTAQGTRAKTDRDTEHNASMRSLKTTPARKGHVETPHLQSERCRSWYAHSPWMLKWMLDLFGTNIVLSSSTLSIVCMLSMT